MRILLLCTSSIFLLSACESIYNPTFMPAGYKNHREVYKSPPGPEAPKTAEETGAKTHNDDRADGHAYNH